jgi:hypothetical protein
MSQPSDLGDHPQDQEEQGGDGRCARRRLDLARQAPGGLRQQQGRRQQAQHQTIGDGRP